MFWLASRLHRPASQFLRGLKGTNFLHSQTQRWETGNEYFSGNVRANFVVADQRPQIRAAPPQPQRGERR